MSRKNIVQDTQQDDHQIMSEVLGRNIQ